MCEGQADAKWIATVIQAEADAPLTESVNGVKESDMAIKVKASKSSGSGSMGGMKLHQHN